MTKTNAPIIFILLFTSCQTYVKQNIVNNIVRVSYNSVNGGKIGGYVSFIVTKDSIVYSLGDNKTAKKYNAALSSKGIWDSLRSSINLVYFDKIKSDPGHRAYDGTDITISIIDSKTHTIINGEDDTINYKMITPLINNLNEIREYISKK